MKLTLNQQRLANSTKTAPIQFCSPFILERHRNTMFLPKVMGYTVAYERIHPPWHFSYFVALQPGIKIDFGGFVSFDLHNTLKMQNIFYCETNNKAKKKNEN